MSLKVTSITKLYFHEVAHGVQLMTFFIWRKSNTSFSRYLDFCVFLESTGFKICDALPHNESYTYAYFFWIQSMIKMKLG